MSDGQWPAVRWRRGDIVDLTIGSRMKRMRITDVQDHGFTVEYSAVEVRDGDEQAQEEAALQAGQGGQGGRQGADGRERDDEGEEEEISQEDVTRVATGIKGHRATRQSANPYLLEHLVREVLTLWRRLQ